MSAVKWSAVSLKSIREIGDDIKMYIHKLKKILCRKVLKLELGQQDVGSKYV